MPPEAIGWHAACWESRAMRRCRRPGSGAWGLREEFLARQRATESHTLGSMADTVSAVTPTTEVRSQAPGLFVGLSAALPTAPPAMIALSGLDEVRIERGERRVERTGRAVVVGLDDPHLSQR